MRFTILLIGWAAILGVWSLEGHSSYGSVHKLNCSHEIEKETLNKNLSLLEERIEALLGDEKDSLNRVSRLDWEWPLNQRFRSRLIEVFEKMKVSLENGITVSCLKENAQHCRNFPDRLALTRLTLDKKGIHVCPEFFSLNSSQKMTTMMHELSHYASNTNDRPVAIDHLYRNAYFIEQFANFSTSAILKKTREGWQTPWLQTLKVSN